MAASLATVDDLYGSITGRAVHVEVRTASARGDELLVAQRPPWLDTAAAKLETLTELGDNWDSYGGRRIAVATVLEVFQLLAGLYALGLTAPTIVPTSNGGIQLEWRVRELELELSFEPNGRMLALFDDASRGESWERELPPRDLAPIRDVLLRIAHAGHPG